MSRKFFFILMSVVSFCFVGGCVTDGGKNEINIEQFSEIKKQADIYKTALTSAQSDIEHSDIEHNVFEKKVKVSFYKEPLSRVIRQLIKNFEFEEGVPINIPITLNAEKKTVSEILTRILKPKGLGYVKRSNNSIIIIKQPVITFMAYNQPFGLVVTAMLSGYNYSLKDGAEDELNTIVTADFDEIPLSIALDRLLAQIKLFWEKKDGVYYIYKEKEALFDIFFPLMSQSFEITSSRIGNTVGGSGTVSSSASTNSYSDGGMSSALSTAMAFGKTSTVESLSETIKPFLTETGKFAIHKETGTIWIRDRGDVVDRIGEFIAKLNKRLRIPVNVKGIITEVTLNKAHEHGIDWDKALSSTALNGGFFKVLSGDKSLTGSAGGFSSIASNTIAISASFAAGALNSYIRALEEYGDVKVISKPSLTVLNGAIGSLIVGQTLSYVAQSYSSKTVSDAVTTSIIVKPLQTGLSFYVLPRIISDEEALVYISPEITALQEQRTIQAGDNATVEAPSLSLKQTQTVVNVKNGSTILISGLMAEEEIKTDKRVPFVGDIPILGIPFQYKSTHKKISEVAIMVEVSW
ncbi:MAG: hypothetical protein JRJ44_00065 [Deltaproteobacteria bacterium]|nr:hypothetical protein [Deltaproteobacteria bacterium]